MIKNILTGMRRTGDKTIKTINKSEKNKENLKEDIKDLDTVISLYNKGIWIDAFKGDK